MKGRKIGSTEVTLAEIHTIARLTKKQKSRPDIARAINRSQNTVWRYQKKLNLI